MTGTENRVRERETDTDKLSETDRYRDDRQKDTKRHKNGEKGGGRPYSQRSKAKGLLSKGSQAWSHFQTTCAALSFPWGLIPGNRVGSNMTVKLDWERPCTKKCVSAVQTGF